MGKSKAIYLAAAFFAIMAAVIFCNCNDESKHPSKVVSVLIYSEYIDPAMLDDFQRQAGYTLSLDLYEAQEEMIAKLQSADTKPYDVIIASDVVIQQMVNLGLIAAIDTNKVPNHVNIAPQFKNPNYDPNNTYTLPYLWGTTGILYRDKDISPDQVSYSMLFDSTKTKGSFSLLEESRSMLSMALLAKGFDANSVDKKEIDQAAELILQAKKDPHFVGFDGSVGSKDKVLSGKDWAAIVFNGEAMAAIDEDHSLQFSIPVEGSFMWVDAMTIGSRSQNVEGAYAFMNYILDGQIGAQLAKFINYATPNKASIAFLDKEFTGNHVINPSEEEISRMVFLRDPGEAAKLFDEAWKTIKTR